MKLIICADTHKDYWRLNIPAGDVFILAGDIDLYRYDKEFNHFNEWLKTIPCKYKIVVGGNHDGLLEDWGKRRVQEELTNGIYLENSSITIDKIKFYGSPFSPKFKDWAFMRERGKYIKVVWDLIPNDVDILITHSPPYKILDYTVHTTKLGFQRKMHLGCRELLKKVREVKPKIHIFGHIHYAHGIERNHDTLFVNASVKNDVYDLVHNPLIVDIEKGKAKYGIYENNL